jgi:hypothetical protein
VTEDVLSRGAKFLPVCEQFFTAETEVSDI